MFLEYCSHVRDVDMNPEDILNRTHLYQGDSSTMGTFGPVELKKNSFLEPTVKIHQENCYLSLNAMNISISVLFYV